jgi:hypothetical protein
MCKNSRNKKMRQMMLVDQPYNVMAPLLMLYGDTMHLLDILTDLTLAKKMYTSSRNEISSDG